MNVRNDGGRAFPSDTRRTHEFGSTGSTHDGMTLRDYFAAKAMQAMIATAAAPCMFGLDGLEDPCTAASYRIADAMLCARGSA